MYGHLGLRFAAAGETSAAAVSAGVIVRELGFE